MVKCEVRRSITRIFKNDRKFQVFTRFILSLEERKTILTEGFTIDEFILELINDYKYEESESLVFRKETNFISAFECEVELISFIENQSVEAILEKLEDAYERLLPYYERTRG